MQFVELINYQTTLKAADKIITDELTSTIHNGCQVHPAVMDGQDPVHSWMNLAAVMDGQDPALSWMNLAAVIRGLDKFISYYFISNP